MKLSHLRFSKFALCEVALIVILLPMAISFWGSAFQNMGYYRNFQYALRHYSVGSAGEVQYGIDKAERAKHEVSLNIFRANFEVEQDRIEEARNVYTEMLETAYDVSIPKLGLVVCKLYQLEREDNQKATTLLEKEMPYLEKEVKDLVSKYPDFPDSVVLLGQICLKQAYYAQKAGKPERVQPYISTALNHFAKAETITNSSYPALSRSSCLSLYMGKALAYYMKAMDKLPTVPQPSLPSASAQEISELVYDAVQSLRKAFLLRLPHPDILPGISYLYLRLHSFPWLEVQTTRVNRRALLQECEEYLKEFGSFRSHLMTSQDDKASGLKWQITPTITYPIIYGMALSYFYLDNEDKAEEILSPINQSIEQNVVQNFIMQIHASRETKRYRAHIKNHPDVPFAVRYDVREPYRRQWENIVKTKAGRFTSAQFPIANNYVVLQFCHNERGTPLLEACALLEKISYQLPDQKFLVGAKEDPVNTLQIAFHNLYKIYQVLPSPHKEKAERFASYQLTVKK